MHNQMRRELSEHRLSRAEELIDEAETLYEAGSFKGANNRAYYAVFSSMRALLALEGEDFKRHSGVIQYFQKTYIKSGKIEKRFSDIITSASTIRNASDYDDFFVASKEETKKQIENAKDLLNVVKELLESEEKH